MGTGRDATKVEIAIDPVFLGIRNLDKMLWHHCSSRPSQATLRAMEEEIEDFDCIWKAFKEKFKDYKGDVFIERL